MLSESARPVALFSDNFQRVFGMRPDYSRLVSDRGYATNVLLTAQRCSDLPLKKAAFELSTMLGTSEDGLTTAEAAAHADAVRRRKPGIGGMEYDPEAPRLERASALIHEVMSTYLTPFKAHTLNLRLQRLGNDADLDRLLGDLQGELMRSVNTESAMQIMKELRTALK
jgi:hypothetical protein